MTQPRVVLGRFFADQWQTTVTLLPTADYQMDGSLVPYRLTLDTFCTEIPSCHCRNDDALGYRAQRGGGGPAEPCEVIAVSPPHALDHADVAQSPKLA